MLYDGNLRREPHGCLQRGRRSARLAWRARDRADRALGPGQRPGARHALAVRQRRPPRCAARGAATFRRADRTRRGRRLAGQRPDYRRDHRGRQDPVHPHRGRRRAARGGGAALHRTAAAAVRAHRGRHRPAPHRGAVRRARRRAVLRPRPASARKTRPEGRRGRADPAQHRGQHPLPAVQRRLRIPVEQPGHRPGRTRHHRHPLGVRGVPPVGLLGDGRAGARGHRSQVHGGHRAGAHAAGMGGGVLAVQAQVPDPGRAARRGTRVQAARTAPVGDRRRLLPLDQAGRLAVRPRGMA